MLIKYPHENSHLFNSGFIGERGCLVQKLNSKPKGKIASDAKQEGLYSLLNQFYTWKNKRPWRVKFHNRLIQGA